jgi:hypothetical protein
VAAIPDLESVLQRIPGGIKIQKEDKESWWERLLALLRTRLPDVARWFMAFLRAGTQVAMQWRVVVAFLLLAVIVGWWWTQLRSPSPTQSPSVTAPADPPKSKPSLPSQTPPQKPLRERVEALWRAKNCSKAETALEEARRQQPDAAEPYLVAIHLLLQGGSCPQALGTKDPVVLLGEAIRRGVAGSLPFQVEIKTAYGATLTVKPEQIRTLAQDRIELQDGSRYKGTIKIKGG